MKPPIPWRAKLKAFAAHGLISVAIFVAIIALTVRLWYPPPFFWIDGGLQITLLAAAIDIVAGPLLTFVVYRPKKPRLTMNLAVIAAVQFAALTWGVQALYSQRPVAAAFIGHNQNRFFPVTEEQLRDGPLPLDELPALSTSRPPLVYVELPDSEAEMVQVLTSSTTSPLRQSERFRRIEGERLLHIVRGSRTPEMYEKLAPEVGSSMEEFAASRGGALEDFAFVPLVGRFGAAMLALSRTDGSLAGVVSKEVSLK